MTIKISKLEIENTKRVKAVKIEPSKNGLTIIGGKNGQGKTSVLDSIAWALGGDRYKPSQPEREGSVIPPYLHIVLDNGLVVERKGKNSSLKVTDPEGRKSGQGLLDSFVEQFALDLPKFMNSSGKEKARTLLQIIGVGDKLTELENEEKRIYNERRTIGQIADQKEKFAKEQPYYPDAPKDLVSPSDLIKQQQEILARNGENQKKRNQLTQIQREKSFLSSKIQQLQEQINSLTEQYDKTLLKLEELTEDEITATKTVESLIDESTAELEKNIANIETINIQVRANFDKEKAEEEALNYRSKYSALTAQIEDLRKNQIELLENADLPLPGLSVKEGELLYNNFAWDNMSGSEQLKVATAIVRKLNPNCGFVLMDKLEQMDNQTLEDFGAWLESEGLQVIATRVSTGDECSIIIEDGYSIQSTNDKSKVEPKTWKAGEF